MKKLLLFVIAFVAVLLVGCKTSYPVAMQTGQEDMAYLVFVGPLDKYGNGAYPVQVDIDGTKFDAKVIKPKVSNRKGFQYGVGLGNRHLKVTFRGETVYEKQIFLSTQETKVINLP